MKMKTQYSLWEIAVELFFFWILMGMFRAVPSIISTIVKYFFIAVTILAFVKEGLKIRVSDPVCGFGISYIIVSVFSVILSKYFNVSMVVAEAQFILINLCCLVIPIEYLKKPLKKFMDFLILLMILAVALSAITVVFGNTTWIGGVRINYIGTPLLGQRKMGTPGDFGYSSFFSNPNPFGSYIVIAISWILASKNIKKPLVIIELLILTGGLLLPNSRAAYLCFAIVLVTYAYANADSVRKRGIILMAAVASSIVLLVAFGDKLYIGLTEIDLNGRQGTWDALIESIKQNPILGTGFSSGTKAILDTTKGTYNAYLTILVDTGAIGMLVFIGMVATMLTQVWKCTDGTEKREIIRFYIMFTFAMLLLGIVENVFMNITARYLLWVIVSRVTYQICKEIGNGEKESNES